MTAPTFFIVGAQKAGTTSLHAMLSQHDEVFMSDPKEPGYFIRGFDDEERWQTLLRPNKHGEIEQLSQVPLGVFDAQSYENLFSSPQAMASGQRGESSTPYLPSPNACRRIKETVPGAKIIIILRDPVSRAYSAWGYNSSRGRESAASFEEAIAEELAGNRDRFIYGWRYIYSGLYSQHIRRYLEHFRREDMLILSFDELKADGQTSFDKVCDFLEIARKPVTAIRRENVTVNHSNPVVEKIRNSFNRPGILKSLVRPLMSRGLRSHIRRSLTTSLDQLGDRPAPMSASARETLVECFKDDLDQLKDLVPFDISHWAGGQADLQGEDNG